MAWVSGQSYEKATVGVWGSVEFSMQEVDGEREFEISYRIRRDCWGMGLATEAAELAGITWLSRSDCTV